MSDLTRDKTKTAADFEGQEPDLEIKLELYDASGNHNKFWHAWVYGKYVVRKWGRHLTKGQSGVWRTYSNWSAKDEVRELARKKRIKGYVKDDSTVLDQMVRDIDLKDAS